MKKTYEQMISDKKKYWDKKITQVGKETHYYLHEKSDSALSYNDVTHWFPSLLEQFPFIQFIYRRKLGTPKDWSTEEIHVVMFQSNELVSLKATIRIWNKWVSPRVVAEHLSETCWGRSAFPASNFQEVRDALIQDLLKLPRYKACIRNEMDLKGKQITFSEWKNALKGQELFTLGEEHEHQLELIHIRKSTYRHYYTFCEDATSKLHKRGIPHAFIGCLTIIEDGNVFAKSFCMLYYHKDELLYLEVDIEAKGMWEELKVSSSYTTPKGTHQSAYVEHDIDGVKRLFLEIIKEEPSVRMLVITGVLKEKKNP